MSEEIQDEPHEPSRAEDQASQLGEGVGDADPADCEPSRSHTHESAPAAGRWQQHLGASIARIPLPQMQVLRTQRIAENALRSMGGLDKLQQRFLALQPQLRVRQQLGASIARNLLPQMQVVRMQQRITENALRSMGGFDKLQQQLLAPQLDAFRQFAKVEIPQLIKLPKLNLPTDWFPPNWEDAPELDIDAAIGFVLDEGIPLVWVPGPAIVVQLVGAPDGDARDGVLLSARDDIARDCISVLAEIGSPDLKPLVELAVEAVTGLRSGHHSGAQALAGNVFDTLLRDATRRGVIFAGPPVGYFRYDKVRKQITPVSDTTAISRFRAACVLSAALSALETYDPSDPPPARFVRHATAHRAHPIQYTPVNAIVAVMLMVSMLREAEASGW